MDSEEAAARARLQKQLAEEAANLEAARLKYTPTHPEVRRLEETVASLAARVGPPDAGRGNVDLTADMAEYQSLRREKSKLQAKLAVLEKSRDDQIGQGQKSDAYGRYRRLQSELAVDREMLGLLLSRRNETMVASAKQDTGARVLDAAVAPLDPAGPGRTKLLGLAWLAAIAAGFGVAGLMELLDRRLRDPDRISRLLGMPALCTLPVLPVDEAVPERQGGLPPGSIGSERYRSLRTALVFAMRMRKVHTLLVTSGIPGEGKTTTCANLAAAFARTGKKVVLIDADMRRPRLHRVFGVARSPGLAEVLANKARLSEALLRPKGEEFELLPAGALPENPTDLLASGAWSDLIGELKQDYELVVIDSPVVLAVSDSLLLAADADGLLLVHKPGSLERRGLVQLRDDLRRAGARPLGVVFNQVDRSDRDLYPVYLESPYLQTSERQAPAPESRLRTRDAGWRGGAIREGVGTRRESCCSERAIAPSASRRRSRAPQRRALRVIGFLDDDPSEEDRRKLGPRYLGRLDHAGRRRSAGVRGSRDLRAPAQLSGPGCDCQRDRHLRGARRRLLDSGRPVRHARGSHRAR